jgi:hypothetical protein
MGTPRSARRRSPRSLPRARGRAHSELEANPDAYIDAVGILTEGKGPLFPRVEFVDDHPLLISDWGASYTPQGIHVSSRDRVSCLRVSACDRQFPRRY